MSEEEKKLLIERCRKGQEMISQRLEQIYAATPDADVRDEKASAIFHEAMLKWDAAVLKLNLMCTELNAQHNFWECLYQDSPTFEAQAKYCNDRRRQTNHPCWACPKKWETFMFPPIVEKAEKTKPRTAGDLFSTAQPVILVDKSKDILRAQPKLPMDDAPPHTDEELR